MQLENYIKKQYLWHKYMYKELGNDLHLITVTSIDTQLSNVYS